MRWRLRAGDPGPASLEDEDGVERHGELDRPPSPEGLRAIEVVVPRPLREVDQPAALSRLPDGCDQQVRAEEVLVPTVGQLPIAAVEEGHGTDDRHPGRGALLADDRAPEPEVGPRTGAEVLAAGDVAAPEDRVLRGAGVGRAREEDEVAVRIDARQGVVVDLRLQRRVVVSHLAPRAAIT